VRGILGLLEEWEVFNKIAAAQTSRRGAYVCGLTRGAAGFLLAGLLESCEKPVLVLAAREDRLHELADDLRVLLTEGAYRKLLVFPSLDTMLYEEISPDPALLRDRLSVLERLAAGEPVVILATPAAAFHLTLPSEVFKNSIMTLRRGEEVSPTEACRRLVSLGYERDELVEQPGRFSLRGGILDIFPSTADQPTRLEFFGDTIESLRIFEVSSQRSLAAVDELKVACAREFLLEDEAAARALPSIRASLEAQLQKLPAEAGRRLRAEVGRDIELLEQRTYAPGQEYYLPYLYPAGGRACPPEGWRASPQRATVLDYLPEDASVIIEEPDSCADAFEKLQSEIGDLYRLRLEHGAILPIPHPFYLGLDEAMRLLKPKGVIELYGLPRGEREELNAESLPVEALGGRPDIIASSVKTWRDDGYRAVAITQQGERLAEILAQWETPTISQEEALDLPAGPLMLGRGQLSQGFQLPGLRLVVLSDAELFGWRKARRPPRRRRASAAVGIASVTQLRPGDYVVHIHHGIGLYAGVVRRAVNGSEREYLQINYAENDKLFVPVEQLDRVQKYIGGEEARPVIHRLGGGEWERTKRRAMRSAREFARELLQLYAARSAAHGKAFSPDLPWQQEMEAGFAYEETPDQWKAIQEVKTEMEQPMPMDRLVCGDVGYGKTEVAIRAAFKAVLDDTQAAVLVPTTVLAQQHYQTFSERLTPYPVRVEMLSRFQNRKEQQRIVEGIHAGTVDIVIGTHRLLSRDVEFKRLGLLIVDEEHRFGVRQKEKIKQLKTSVDVLTLTATPIPRTLHMALSGLREMSTINDPPEGRLPIRTKAMAREDEVLREAVLREMERGGQAFFVHNRVESIGHAAEYVRKLVPHARIAIGHGQLPEEDLERRMLDFYAGQYDVLVCTSIIESGLDIPNCNTTIIDRCEQFGLAQLYQLRGRVGRSDRQAYAYLTWTPHKRLTDIAQRRIEAIREFAELGSGFKIAMRDLEIRGAGNILGPEQHGFIAAVGFELYCQMLAQAVSELKGEPAPAPQPEVTIDLPVPAFLPEEYVPSLSQRMELYKRMAGVRDEKGLRILREEVVDRYGRPVPEPVQNLLRMLRIKLWCLEAGAASVSGDRRSAAIRFQSDRLLSRVEAERLRGLASAVPDSDFRLAMPEVSSDRIALSTFNLKPDAILRVVGDIVEQVARLRRAEQRPDRQIHLDPLRPQPAANGG
jgi:transcription-repair coupling factor (superfamily II helicase)